MNFCHRLLISVSYTDSVPEHVPIALNEMLSL
jgi:hypothetical protein